MRTIKTTTSAPIPLDGDLLAIMEVLYREVTARRELNRSFEDMTNEITHLIDQMDESERRAYLLESLPQYRPLRERQARGVHEENLTMKDEGHATRSCTRRTFANDFQLGDGVDIAWPPCRSFRRNQLIDT